MNAVGGGDKMYYGWKSLFRNEDVFATRNIILNSVWERVSNTRRGDAAVVCNNVVLPLNRKPYGCRDTALHIIQGSLVANQLLGKFTLDVSSRHLVALPLVQMC